MKTMIIRKPGQSLEELLDSIPTERLSAPADTPTSEWIQYFSARLRREGYGLRSQDYGL